jgi:branched-chain amino acid transport system ATP-binding protein
MSLLSVKDVSLSFGGIQALSGVSLELNRGEILGLIGPNGAGKTTLFNCLSGVLVPDSGQIRFEDRSIARLKAHQRARRGIARTFQDLQLWGSMTVLENCQLPIDALGNRNMVFDALRLPNSINAERSARERARGVLHALRLLDYADVPAGDLPVGLQRRVEVARALCMKPKLLLLDEPASGLDAKETLELADQLAVLRDRFKVSILLVDHDMSLVMRACHYIYVLDFGELIAAGRPEQIRNDPRVIEAYLGEGSQALEEPAPAKSKNGAKPAGRAELEAATAVVVQSAPAAGWAMPESEPDLLTVRELHAGYGGIEVIRDVNIIVGAGEVVACIGANGAGKTTTLRAISGVIKPNKGTVIFDGADITRKRPEAIVRAGMMHIPQGRGLFPQLTVLETLKLGWYSGQKSGDFSPAFDAFPVLASRRNQVVGTLSGGEQQMVAMARALLVKPKLLLIDEMSQGLAPAVVEQLFKHIRGFKEQGIAVFLVEQFVDSALAVADRAYVFEQGTVAHEELAATLRQDQAVLASSYLGTAVDVEAPTELDGNVAALHPNLLAEWELRLPAELKRSLEERARTEGRAADELILDMLSRQPAGRSKKK